MDSYKDDSVKDYILNEFMGDSLEHEGVKRRSGRYPWGSGENPYQHEPNFYNRVRMMRKDGFTEAEIAHFEGMSTEEYKRRVGKASNEMKAPRIAAAVAMSQKGLGPTEIARKVTEEFGIQTGESTIRNWLKNDMQHKVSQAQDTADFLKARMADTDGYLDISKGANLYIDIGDGVASQLGVSDHKFNQAIEILKDEGYVVYNRKQKQVTNAGQWTDIKVLCPPGTEYKDVYQNQDKIKSVVDFHSEDGGSTFYKFEYPKSLDSKRLQVVYAEDGGKDKDGLIELRRGVEDISLGGDHYAQVRILVDGTHYLKGMACYADDLPKGVDVRFNTNKHEGTPVLGDKKSSVLKLIERDKQTGEPMSNPFGATITPDNNTRKSGQRHYVDENGEVQLSVINKKNWEGGWEEWSNTLPSQFLAKQDKKLIERQLNLTKAITNQEYEEIMSLTNPVVRKNRLEAFAESCDSASANLKAAALPRQKIKVILPMTSIGDNEVYAPGFTNGEKVALVRYPHAGPYEIPILKVNNNLPEGKRMMSATPIDAIGINAKVAEKLSGADFDGDFVQVIPTNSKVKIQSRETLQGLKDFDPKEKYGGYDEEKNPFKLMKKTQKGNEMGKISNLITDMTLQGADDKELARAVRHSMVVIDAEKHKLNYKQSEVDNQINALKKKYQQKDEIDERTGENKYGGAGTLLSRAKSPINDLPLREGQGYTNVPGVRVGVKDKYGNMHWEDGYDPSRPEGAKLYKTAVDEKRYYVDKNGKQKERYSTSKKMYETDDARTLISEANTIQENLYADFANYQKAMANKARKEAYSIKGSGVTKDKALKAEYANEIASINNKIKLAKSNSPREREAQRLAEYRMKSIREDNPDMSKEDQKKRANIALQDAREALGASRYKFDVTPREWEAIQKHVVSDSVAEDLFKYMDATQLNKLAMPKKDTSGLNAAKIARMKAMKASGSTLEDIAKSLGVSVSTVQRQLNQ